MRPAAWIARRWRHLQAARPASRNCGYGATAGPRSAPAPPTRVPPSGGAARRWSGHRVAPRSNVIARRHQASRRTPFATCFFGCDLHPRWRRVIVGGNTDDSSCWQSARTARAVSLRSRALWFGAGSSELEPAASFHPGRHSCRRGGSRASGGSRGGVNPRRLWLSKRGEGRSRPEPIPRAMPSRRGARALRRGGGANGGWRQSHGRLDLELVSGSCRRQG